MAAHELDQSDSIGCADGFDVRSAEGSGGFGEGGLEAEALVDELDVVVDGFGDADDGDVAAAGGGLLRDAHSAADGSVAADDEEEVDAHGFEAIDDD